MKNSPKIADSNEYTRIDGLVGDHKYRVFSAASEVPFGLAEEIGDKFITCVVVGSGYEPKRQIELPDRSLTPSGTLYLIKLLRRCDHDGSPHFNIDNYLYYRNSDGVCFKCSAKNPGEHYFPIIDASPLSTLSGINAIPETEEGELKDYVSRCSSLDYVKLCPGLPEK